MTSNRRRLTVTALAREADLDLDEVVVMLWDAGIDEVDAPSDVIPPAKIRRARAVLGLDDPKKQTTVAYWLERTGLSHDELRESLSEMGISLALKARVLPKGALKKLRLKYESTVPQATQEPSEPEVHELPPLSWKIIGSRRELRYLTEADVLEIHSALVRDFAGTDDPIDPPGVRSIDLLSSAASRPMTSLGDEMKYPTIEMAGAALLHSLVLNHPFANGNKRTGIVAMLVFLDRNNMLLTCDDRELFRLVLRVAQRGLVPPAANSRDDREVLEVAQWIRDNSRPIERGERPMPWHKLKRILRSYGCEFSFPGGKGNRINVQRTVYRKRLFGRDKQVLWAQPKYAGDGTEVDRNTLHHLRQRLHLDEEHGIDSKVFYGSESVPDDFIQMYRKVLSDLARL